ncbi:TIM barrel protein [Micrococcoides hystricis]|uniref:TIM barrel protein n=1 Tax=Micrococcoides hystricis TaxID=1572761 RepID=A0ABV6P9A5_9MICC
MTHQLAVMNSTLPALLPAQFAAAAADAGYESVSLRIATSRAGEPFRLLPGSPELAQTKQVLADRGLSVLDLEFVTFTAKTRPEHWRWMVETAVELGAKYLNAGCKHEDRELFAEQVAALDAAAGEAEIRVLLEPIKFYSTVDYQEMAQLAQNLPNTGILLDALQLYRFAVRAADDISADTSGDTVEQLRERAAADVLAVADHTGVFQLCDMAVLDAPAEDPEFFEREARFERPLPGTGIVDISGIVRLLPEQTPISIESPNMEAARQHGNVGYLAELRRRAQQILGH